MAVFTYSQCNMPISVVSFSTCIVTSLSSTMTSFVRKSAPIVALYWLLNFLFTYWFINEVLPTLGKRKVTREHSGRGKKVRYYLICEVWEMLFVYSTRNKPL